MTDTKGQYSVRKVDGNQAEIVDGLRSAGVSVQVLSGVGHGCPDIIAGKNGRNYLFEIKVRGGKMTAKEIEFSQAWRGQYAVVRSV